MSLKVKAMNKKERSTTIRSGESKKEIKRKERKKERDVGLRWQP